MPYQFGRPPLYQVNEILSAILSNESTFWKPSGMFNLQKQITIFTLICLVTLLTCSMSLSVSLSVCLSVCLFLSLSYPRVVPWLPIPQSSPTEETAGVIPVSSEEEPGYRHVPWGLSH